MGAKKFFWVRLVWRRWMIVVLVLIYSPVILWAGPFQCWANKWIFSWIFFFFFLKSFSEFLKFQEMLRIPVLFLWKKLGYYKQWCGFCERHTHHWKVDILWFLASETYQEFPTLKKCSHHSHSISKIKGTGKMQRSQEEAMYSPVEIKK